MTTDLLLKKLVCLTTNISKAVAASIICVLSSCGILEAQWITTQNTIGNCDQVVFLNNQRGYIAESNGTLLITSDGGESWIQRKVSTRSLLSVSAVDDSLVWVSNDSGTVYRSVDGGITWHSVMVTNLPFSLYTVQFVDSANGWISGNYEMGGYIGYGGIFHSTDGGFSWREQYADTTDYFSYLGNGFFIDKSHGYVADQYVILQTSDGGITWTPSEIGGRSAASISFTDSLNGWAACDEGFLGKSNDGGLNWSLSRPISSYNGFTSIFFVDTSDGWVCDDQGRIIHTSDDGLTWSVQRSDSSGRPIINSIFFIDKNDGWAVGNGIILHTTNGGVTAVREPSAQPSSFRLMQNYPNPFNPSTAISFQLSAVSYVSLEIYDVLGREVATLADDKETVGLHTVTWNASRYASGVYFYRLVSSSSQGTFVGTKQMLMIK